MKETATIVMPTPVEAIGNLVEDLRNGADNPETRSEGRERWRTLADQLADRDELWLTPGVFASDVWAGDPSDRSAVAFHAERLSTWDWTTAAGARLEYHLVMLAFAVDPASAAPPLVTIVIPCFNSADCIARAIESCLKQRYPACEILVVNDGSTDHSVAVVDRFGAKVRLVHKPNGGLSSARNAGSLAARGVFIHFLDADDELRPEAVSEKVRAFTEAADATLCFSHYTLESDDGWPIAPEDLYQVPLDDPCSATGDPLVAMTTIYSFQASTAMVPKWLMEETGGFEDRMRMGEDIRCWFRFARHGMKAVALRRPRTHRYCRLGCLTRRRDELARYNVWADLLNAEEMRAEPSLLPYLPSALARATRLLEESRRFGLPEATIGGFHRQICSIERTVGDPADAGRTTLVLEQLVCLLREARRKFPNPSPAGLDQWREREVQLLERLSTQPTRTIDDLRRWLPMTVQRRPFAQLSWCEQCSLRFALNQMQLSMVLGSRPPSFRELANVSADFTGHPFARFWRAAAKIEAILGPAATRHLCRQQWFQRGWAWLGSARRRLHWFAQRKSLALKPVAEVSH